MNNNKYEPRMIQCFENYKDQRDTLFINYTLKKFILDKNEEDMDHGIILKRLQKKKELEDDINILAQIFISDRELNQYLKNKRKQN